MIVDLIFYINVTSFSCCESSNSVAFRHNGWLRDRIFHAQLFQPFILLYIKSFAALNRPIFPLLFYPSTYLKKILPVCFLFSLISLHSAAQTGSRISGSVTDDATGKPIPNATIHLQGSRESSVSTAAGEFVINNYNGSDSMEVSCIGFQPITVYIKNNRTRGLSIHMKGSPHNLETVVVGTAAKPGRSFMQKVIDHKAANNPARFGTYTYRRYTRNELDIDNMDFRKMKGNGLKSLLMKTYSGLDTMAKYDKELPVSFQEKLAMHYHSSSPAIDREDMIAQKNLGIKTDDLLRRFDKFYFNFNVYDDWIPVFDQTYVSPLNTNGFNYYKYFEGDKITDEGDTIEQVRFTPIHAYEKSFSGFMWINTSTLAVTVLNIHLSKTANLNFVDNIFYTEEYRQVEDSSSGKPVYMPYKYSSDVSFQNGPALLGLPVKANKNAIQFVVRNTTVSDQVKLNATMPGGGLPAAILAEQASAEAAPKAFWEQNRSDALTLHEKNIYKMVDSLKKNPTFQRDTRILAVLGSGYWDFGNLVRIGPYSSLISSNRIEGIRNRVSFWTLPGVSKKINVFGYGAYGSKDKKIKGMLGFKYLWDEARWTKTTLSYGSDYDFMTEHDDELDNDNPINSFLRKNVPYSRIYTKQAEIRHEQYLSPDFTALASISYRELNPVFNFQYRPINPALDKPYDSVYSNILPVATASIGIKYDHNERTKVLNYDKLRLGTFSPIFSAEYTYGFEYGKAEFSFHKISISAEQRLRLPPKMFLFYRLDAGKIFGTVPYLLLNIPPGNEYYTTNRSLFNTMVPYEFAADRYISLHTRFYLGGTLLDKIPLMQKLGWRERFSFNAYWGGLSSANADYNKNSNFSTTGKAPFAEAGAGIENIFHVFSIEYFRRLNYLQNQYAKKNGIYLGVTLVF